MIKKLIEKIKRRQLEKQIVEYGKPVIINSVEITDCEAIEELIEDIAHAYDEMIKYKVRANTVVLNNKKYGILVEPGMRPSIIGMNVKVDDLPDEWDFIVQKREPGDE